MHQQRPQTLMDVSNCTGLNVCHSTYKLFVSHSKIRQPQAPRLALSQLSMYETGVCCWLKRFHRSCPMHEAMAINRVKRDMVESVDTVALSVMPRHSKSCLPSYTANRIMMESVARKAIAMASSSGNHVFVHNLQAASLFFPAIRWLSLTGHL